MAKPSVTGLTELQKRFCLINLGGEIRIADKNQIQNALSNITQAEVSFYKKQDGILLMRRYLETLPINTDVKMDIGNFTINPNTHFYDGVAFSPLKLLPTTLNYWTGPTISPIPGNWKELGAFLLDVICSGDEKVFVYLICYLAHMLQRPEEKPGVMLVMLGGQGTGKGTFFSILKMIWGRTTLQINDVDQVLGNFNAALERNYIVCMDEALFSGDKKSLEKLKSLITEPQCRIEQKYQPSRTIDSYHRFFAASNNDHFAKVDKDDRRFLFLRVADKYQGDLTYFESLHKLIAKGNQVSAMVHDLLATNISSFKIRQRPKTDEHLSQKLQSLEGFERYWYEVLQSGELNAGSVFQPISKWDGSVFIPTQNLINQYKEFNKNADRYTPTQSGAMSTCIKKICPSASSTRISGHGGQVRGIQLPTIEIARREFESYIGGKLQWDVDSEVIPKTQELNLDELLIEPINESLFLKRA